jgi:hypothetical protein
MEAGKQPASGKLVLQKKKKERKKKNCRLRKFCPLMAMGTQQSNPT